MRIHLRQIYNRNWIARRYDSPFFGFLWTLFHRHHQTDGMVFDLPHELMPIAFRSRFFFDDYERPERNLCSVHLEAEDKVLEMGACIGIVSCTINSLLSDTTKHIAVEANPLLIPWLEKNRNNNEARYAIEHAMLSRTSDGEFHLNDIIVGGSANRRGDSIVQVPVINIESLVTKHGFTPTTIVMDIEGGEVDFINENEAWLKAHLEVSKMIIEMHPFIVDEDQINQLQLKLQTLGFEMNQKEGSVELWKRQTA